MAKLSLTKSGLQKQRDELKLYQRLLPSLDLKRMQLTGELKRAREQLVEAQAGVERYKISVAKQLSMLANREIDVSGLVRIESIRVGEENVVGVKLPVLEEIVCTVAEYSMLAKPHWVDTLVEQLKHMVELRAQVRIAEQRVQELELAVRRITQRVNLFEKILIPTAKKHIQRIQIFLGDAERSAVVRSKLAKAIHERQRQAFLAEGALS